MPLGGLCHARKLTWICLALAAWLLAAAPRSPATWPQSVTLQVVTALGGPAVGAEVEVWDDLEAAGVIQGSTAAMRPPGLPREKVSVDASGLCTITLPGPAAVFAAGVPGLASSGLLFAGELDEGPHPPVVLHPPGVIEGLVRTADGIAVPDARVEFRSPSSNPDWTKAACGRGQPRGPLDVTSGPDGRFRAPAEWGWSGTARAIGPAESSAAVDVTWTSGAPRPVELLLPGRYHVTGRCVDGEGRPLAAAWVSARGPGHGHPVRSDDDGRFDVATGAPGRFQVTVTPEGRSDSERRLYLESLGIAILTLEEPRAAVSLRMLTGLSLAGAVRDAQGTPLACAHVRARADDAAGLPRGLAVLCGDDADTREDGTFLLEGLRPGVGYDIEVSLSNVTGWSDRDARPMLLDVATGVRPEGPPLDLVLDETVLYGGRALVRTSDARSGNPVSATIIEAWELRHGRLRKANPHPRLGRELQADGDVLLDGLPVAWPCVLVVSANGCVAQATPPFDARREPRPLHVELTALAPIRLRVIGPDGQPAAGASVTLLDAPLRGMEADVLERLRSAGTDAEGLATLSGAEGLPVHVVAQASGTSSGVVALTPRHDVADEIELRLLAEPVTGDLEIGGFDPPGVPVVGGTFSLSRHGATGDVGWRHGAASIPARVDADGIARVAALPSGLWWVTDVGGTWFDRALVAVLPGRTTRVDLRTD